MNVAALADQIVTVKAAMSYLTAIETRLRDELSQAMDPGDRKTAKARGAVIGSVTLTNPDAAWKVTDGRAWREWVKTNRPDEIVTVEAVNSAFEKAMLERGCDENGEAIPGVELVSGNPVVQVRPISDALAVIVHEYGSLGARLAAIEGSQ